MREVSIAIAGAGGRMGRMLVQAVEAHGGCRLVAASESLKSEHLGRDAGEVAGTAPSGVMIQSGPGGLFAPGRVVIDFTIPQTVSEHMALAVEHQTAMVIGTTGVDGDGLARIKEGAGKVPVVFAPNFSVGVNVMFKVAAQVAALLGDGFDVEIIEAHHRYKVDAPSGTALGLGRAIAEATGRDLESVALFGRHGHTGARSAATIGFSTIRGGDIVGDHTALFAGEGERFEITHRASSRMTFARGAVLAACWVAGKPPGLYDMGDILGLNR